jgi:DHA1 family bicyclomycin/chloramphenicol resistance-like MFS transporter
LVLYVIASLGCAFAPGLGTLVALRFLQALGSCAGQVIGRAMVRDRYDAQEAARIYSILMLVMGVAPILAPLAGGWVLAWAGWRGIFWVLAAFGLLCWAASWLLPETQPPEARSRLGLGAIAAGYAELLRDRRFLGYALAGAVGQAGMFAYIAGSPFVFITLHHVPASRYGLYFGLNALGLIAASQLNARLLRRHDASHLLARALTATAGLGLVLAMAVATGLGGFW